MRVFADGATCDDILDLSSVCCRGGAPRSVQIKQPTYSAKRNRFARATCLDGSRDETSKRSGFPPADGIRLKTRALVPVLTCSYVASPLIEEDGTLKTESTRRGFVKAAGVGVVGTALAAGAATAQPVSKQANVRGGFLMDAHRCKGCLACVVACKAEFEVPLGAFPCTVKEYEYGRFPNTRRAYIPTVYNQCEKPACVELCRTEVVEHTFTHPDGTTVKFKDKAATFKRPDGIVEIDHAACTACGACLGTDGCPYGVRFSHKRIPAMAVEAEFGRKPGDPITADTLLVVDKCDWCIHRLEKGIVPSCVNTCPGSARLAGNLNDPDSEISKRLAEHKDSVKVLLADKGTSPQCFYIRSEVKNLDKAFRDGVGQREQYDIES